MSARVLVCGGRDYDDRARVYAVLDQLHADRRIIFLIEGGARGADRLAFEWAWKRNVKGWHVPADWETHGKAAGAIRNQLMLDEGKPNLVVAFPGGRGTADMVRRARRAGVEVLEPVSGRSEATSPQTANPDPGMNPSNLAKDEG